MSPKLQDHGPSSPKSPSESASPKSARNSGLSRSPSPKGYNYAENSQDSDHSSPQSPDQAAAGSLGKIECLQLKKLN